MPNSDKDLKSQIIEYLKKPKSIFAIIVGLVFIYAVYDIFFSGEFRPPLPKNIYLSGDSATSQLAIADKKNQPNKKDSNSNQNKRKAVEEVGKVTNIFTIHEVKKGEVLNLIAKRYHISKEVIKNENKLTSESIKLGQKLKIPIKARHKIKAGETLNSLVKKYSVKKEFIMTTNNMIKESDLKAGKDIIIPL